MPCHSAKLENVLVVEPDTPVEKALNAMTKKKAQIAAVVDEAGRLLGYLTMKVLLKNLLPVSLTMQGAGRSADVVVGAAPGIAKRLRKVKPIAVHNIMERTIHSVSPNTPTWEGVQMLVEYGGPIFILEEGEGGYVGVMDETSIIAELERIQNENGE